MGCQFLTVLSNFDRTLPEQFLTMPLAVVLLWTLNALTQRSQPRPEFVELYNVFGKYTNRIK